MLSTVSHAISDQLIDYPGAPASLEPYANLASDPRFATEAHRLANDEALASELAAVFAIRSNVEWERDLLAVDVACVTVTTETPEIILWSDEFGRASGYLVDVEHPTFDHHPRLAPTVQFSRSITQAKPGVLPVPLPMRYWPSWATPPRSSLTFEPRRSSAEMAEKGSDHEKDLGQLR